MTPPQPFYEDPAVRIYHGDAFGLLGLDASPFEADVMITDPPFSERTHAGAMTGMVNSTRAGIRGTVADSPKKAIDFASWSSDEVALLLQVASACVSSWAIVHCDWIHAASLAEESPFGWRFVRLGLWIKTNPAPAFTGDRPGQGWESIAMLHRERSEPSEWNGGGSVGIWTGPRVQKARYPSEKPLWLERELVRLFTRPGDTILDPCCGSGTILRAAKDLGRKAIGIDIDREAVGLAAELAKQETLYTAAAPWFEERPLEVLDAAPKVKRPKRPKGKW